MKITQLFASLAAFGAIALFAVAADAPALPTPYTVTISNAHVCCGTCVKVAAATVKSLDGVTAVANQSTKTIVVTAADKATAQKAVDLLTGAGFYGKASDDTIKVNSVTGAKDGKVSSLEVSNLHLCCGSCVKAVNAILAKVDGVTANTAAVNAKTFTITGDFKPTDVMAAFQKGGLTGKAGTTLPEAPAPTPAKTS